MQTVSLEVLNKIANLSKLNYNENELLTVGKDLEKILDYVHQVADVVPEKEIVKNFYDAKTELRSDEIKPSLTQSEVVSNSTGNNGVAFVIPQVLD